MASQAIHFGSGWIQGWGLIYIEVGKYLDKIGMAMVGTTPRAERPSSWRRVVGFRGMTPIIDPTCFVAVNANVIGKVHMRQRVGVFYGSVVRADLREVTIAQNTVIMDKCTVRCTPTCDTHIGSHVTIEPHVVISGAEIADDVFIGSGSVVMEGARIESQTCIAPGSTVQKYTVIPSGELWAGCPAEKVRDLTDEEVESLRASAIHAVGLAGAHKDTNEKHFIQRIEENALYMEWLRMEVGRCPIRAPYGMFDPGPIGSGWHLNMPGQLMSPTGKVA